MNGMGLSPADLLAFAVAVLDRRLGATMAQWSSFARSS